MIDVRRFTIAITSAAFLAAASLAMPIVASAQSDAGARDAGQGDASSDARYGRLPPEVIQRIVRANFGTIKVCYTDGLRRNPDLQGHVATKFVIETSGRVSSAGDGGSDLPDERVKQCVFDAFKKLEFPQPEGGIVTVIYPLILTPGS